VPLTVASTKKTGVIFLRSYELDNNHYVDSPGGNFDSYFNKNGYFEDDLRRCEMFMEKIKASQRLLDLGCEWGGFLRLAQSLAKDIEGAELHEAAACYTENAIGIKVHRALKEVESRPDLITMFHVLEHIPNQLEMLKDIHSKLAPGGTLIIEVPHARDFLMQEIELVEFRNFSLWNEHLLLHTKESLRKFVEATGFVDIKISSYQRYGFLNHYGWLHDRLPGGHNKYSDKFDEKLDAAYKKWLVENDFADTLICEARKPE
jgi:2-polyprenyl-3-methyl-5-hydroxy-6-metoxy-1,4-benzoquinol methylase